jgi:hypothetical protein
MLIWLNLDAKFKLDIMLLVLLELNLTTLRAMVVKIHNYSCKLNGFRRFDITPLTTLQRMSLIIWNSRLEVNIYIGSKLMRQHNTFKGEVTPEANYLTNLRTNVGDEEKRTKQN